MVQGWGPACLTCAWLAGRVGHESGRGLVCSVSVRSLFGLCSVSVRSLFGGEAVQCDNFWLVYSVRLRRRREGPIFGASSQMRLHLMVCGLFPLASTNLNGDETWAEMSL